MSIQNPLRLQYRYHLIDAVGQVVRDRKSARAVVDELRLTDDRAPVFMKILLDELHTLEVFNCARYRLTMSETQDWIAANRPH